MAVNQQRKYIKLCELIRYSNLEDVKRFVADEHITTEEYYSLWETASDEHRGFKLNYPLCIAAVEHASDILRFLISLGFDPDGAHLGKLERPIHYACAIEDDDETKDEEEHEESIQADEKQSRRHNEVARILVEDHNVDVNVIAAGNNNMTPLLLASCRGQVENVKLFLKAGAHLDARESHSSFSALHLAAQSGSAELCGYLLSVGMYVNETEQNGRSPLHYAAYFGRLKAAEKLLDNEADVNMLDMEGCSPLGSAFQNSDLNLIRFLCSRGANPEQEGEATHFLHEAIELEKYDIARYLVVEMGVSLQTRDFDQNTPFALAMKRGKIKFPMLLVSCGCDIYREPCIFDTSLSHHYSILDSEWKSFVSSLKSPRSLQDSCCFKIRALLGRHIVQSVTALAVPNSVKKLLLLSHV